MLVNSGEQAESLSSSRLIGLGGGYAVIGCGTYMEEQQMIEGRVAWIGVVVLGGTTYYCKSAAKHKVQLHGNSVISV